MHLGALVATFSIGRLLITNPIGVVTDVYHHKAALIICAVLVSSASILWSISGTLGSLSVLYISQFLLGLGTGSLGTTRSFVSEQTPAKDKTVAMSRFSALQYAGFAGTPLLGAALIMMSGNVLNHYWPYGLPAIVIAICAFISLRLLIFSFYDIEEIEEIEQARKEALSIPNDIEGEVQKEQIAVALPAVAAATPTAKINNSNKPTKSSTSSELSLTQKALFVLFISLNFTTRGGIAVYETQMSRILLDDYHVSQITLGMIMSGAGWIGVVQLLLFEKLWTKYFSDFELMLLGICLIGLAQLLLINWTTDVTQPMWKVILAIYCIYGFGYPIGNTAVLGCYSKVLKTGKQGVYQSAFAFVGSLSRILLPLISSVSELYGEKNSSFNIVLILMCVSAMAIVCFRVEILQYTSSSKSNPKSENKNIAEVTTVPNPLHHLSSQATVAASMSATQYQLLPHISSENELEELQERITEEKIAITVEETAAKRENIVDNSNGEGKAGNTNQTSSQWILEKCEAFSWWQWTSLLVFSFLIFASIGALNDWGNPDW